MPIEKSLRAFAEENFHGKNYYPVSHGPATLIKPLALAVKKRRPFYMRPFKKWELVVTADLEDYVVKDKKQEFTERVEPTIKKEGKLETAEEDGTRASSLVELGLEVAQSIDVKVKVADDLGELELGKIDLEFLKDPDLRDILAQTTLDSNKMEGLESHKLRLIYLVVYSGQFELKGKRKHEVEVDAGVKALPEVADFLSRLPQIRAKCKKKSILSKVAKRNTRGAVFFKCVRVDYNKDQEGKLKLSEGEFAGISVGDRGGEDNDEYKETMVGLESDEESDLSDSLTDDDIKKLEKIKKAVLMSEKSREMRKQRVKKYLEWFAQALMTDQKKLYPDELTPKDREFLQKIFCPALPGQSIVDLSTFDDEKIQGYAIVLKQIDDLSDEHWDKIEKAWAEPEQDQ